MKKSTSSEEITKLVARAKNGDQTAFLDLYEVTKKHVSAICRRLLGDTPTVNLTDARDIIFERTFVHLNQLRDNERFLCYISCIARNFAVKKKAKARLRRKREISLDELCEKNSNSWAEVKFGLIIGPPCQLENKEELDKVLKKIPSLPKRYRHALTLCILGYSLETISEILGVSRYNAHNLVFRARQKLKGVQK